MVGKVDNVYCEIQDNWELLNAEEKKGFVKKLSETYASVIEKIRERKTNARPEAAE